jgi:hypothetical protein
MPGWLAPGRFAAEDENPEGGGDDVSADVPIVVPPQYKYLATLASVPGRLKSHDGKDKGKVAAAVSAGVLSDGVLRVWDDVHDTETTAKVRSGKQNIYMYICICT